MTPIKSCSDNPQAPAPLLLAIQQTRRRRLRNPLPRGIATAVTGRLLSQLNRTTTDEVHHATTVHRLLPDLFTIGRELDLICGKGHPLAMDLASAFSRNLFTGWKGEVQSHYRVPQPHLVYRRHSQNL